MTKRNLSELYSASEDTIVSNEEKFDQPDRGHAYRRNRTEQ